MDLIRSKGLFLYLQHSCFNIVKYPISMVFADKALSWVLHVMHNFLPSYLYILACVKINYICNYLWALARFDIPWDRVSPFFVAWNGMPRCPATCCWCPPFFFSLLFLYYVWFFFFLFFLISFIYFSPFSSSKGGLSFILLSFIYLFFVRFFPLFLISFFWYLKLWMSILLG